MITSLDPQAQLFLTNLSRIQQQLARANQEVSSGKKVTVPSDAPDQIGSLLQLRADLQHNQQIESNLTLSQTDAQAADSALASAIQLMDKAVQLGSQGANSTSDSTQLQGLSQQVQSVMDAMLSYSQTMVQGKYIFSGDLDQLPTYQADPNAANGVAQLTDALATRRIENPTGGSFAAGLTAEQIFDQRNPDGTQAEGNVFAALGGLKAALLSGDAQEVANAVLAVNSASAHLNQMEAFYGNVEDQIHSAQSSATKSDTQLQTEIGDIQDADIPSAALELTQGQTQLQASFAMQTQMPRKSLFDYLA